MRNWLFIVVFLIALSVCAGTGFCTCNNWMHGSCQNHKEQVIVTLVLLVSTLISLCVCVLQMAGVEDWDEVVEAADDFRVTCISIN